MVPTSFVGHHSARALITDLDNTLYDWFGMWHASFQAMLSQIVEISGISQRTLEAEIRAIHQRRGTSEYSYLIQEIPSLQGLHGEETLESVYEPAIHAYRHARIESLTLYPGVAETLASIKESGATIAAYTESLGFYSTYRLKQLKLDGVIDVLYSPSDHEFPEGVTPSQLRSQPDDAYQLRATRHELTPAGSVKPNVEVLRTILTNLGVAADEAVYVGDSLMKDIVMARDVGVLDAYAAYGQVQDLTGYDLLRRVSHWTQEDVEREQRTNAHAGVTPTITLVHDFSELLNTVAFHG